VSERTRLRIAIQKSGRLNDKSLSLLQKCGLGFETANGKERMLYMGEGFPIDLMMVRDDDIPEYVSDGVCDLGIVGLNILEEKQAKVDVLRKLGFGKCRLSLAVPNDVVFNGVSDLRGKRVATSYPGALKKFLNQHDVQAQIVELSGSVEIAPALAVAEAVCDLVSTGATLVSNGLKEVQTIFESQSVLIQQSQGPATQALKNDLERLLQRIDGVLEAVDAKYIMMNAPRSALEKIKELIPGMEEPSIMSLGDNADRIAIHAVAREKIFWQTIEKLKSIGASSILVLPIEKIIS
jgi:ATP phosphoribosyltransferase